MQSTLDIGLSNARSRGQAARQARKRDSLNKEHQIAQLEAQNQLNPKHGQIRFKPAISQNRSPPMQKVEVLIQKQPAVRHHLPQYTIDGKYLEWSQNYEKLPNSELRSTYDISRTDNTLISQRDRTMTYEKQADQWRERSRILKRLFAVEARAFAKTSKIKITQARRPIFEDIMAKMTNIPKPIVMKIQAGKGISFIRHTDNVKLQQLWELSDLGDYEAIPEVMRRYLESRKNDILTMKKPESSNSYRRSAIEPPSYYLRSANSR